MIATAGPTAGTTAASGAASVGPPGRSRRRRWIALAVLALVVAGGLATGVRYLLVSSNLLVVERFEVTGTTAVPVADVLVAAAVTSGTPLLSVPVDEVSARVAALPGVAAVEVFQDWPDTLRLHVTERVPVALTDTHGGRWLVDGTGLAYAPEASAAVPTASLPTLVVRQPGPHDRATAAALAVLGALPDGVRRELRAVEADSPSMVVLRLTANREVRWGSARDLDRKAAVLTALLSERGQVYDVASPDLPTIRR